MSFKAIFGMCSEGTRTRKFGRVVKALALGASLERGVGSNPTACTFWVAGCRVLGWLSR